MLESVLLSGDPFFISQPTLAFSLPPLGPLPFLPPSFFFLISRFFWRFPLFVVFHVKVWRLVCLPPALTGVLLDTVISFPPLSNFVLFSALSLLIHFRLNPQILFSPLVGRGHLCPSLPPLCFPRRTAL